MRKSWIVGITSILFAMTFAMGFLKVPPTMMLLIEHFGLDLTSSGWLMTIPSVAILVATIPAGILVQRIGAKNTMFVCLGLGIAGNLLGALSPTLAVMLVARALDGAAFGVASVAVPPILAMWFPAQKRGLPMAFFSIWVSVSMLIVFNVTDAIASRFTWRGVWIFVIILSVVLAIVFALVVRKPKHGEGATLEEEAKGEQNLPKVSVFEGFKLPAAWILAIIDLLYTIMFGFFNNYYATYMQNGIGLDLGTANGIYSYATIGMIIGGIVAGVILNKVNKGKHGIFTIILLIPIAVAGFVLFRLTSVGVLIPAMLIIGFLFQFVPPTLFTIGSNIAPRPEMIGPIMAIITFGQSIAGIASPMMVGPIVGSMENANWGNLSVPMLGMMVVSIGFAVVLQFTTYKKKSVSLDK
jgi:MFS family permease